MKSLFEVVACNPNSTGGFVWKLVVETPVTVFGISKTVKRTYYLGGMPQAVEVGTKMEESLTKFDIIEREFKPEDAQPDDKPIMLKWLHAKAA